MNAIPLLKLPLPEIELGVWMPILGGGIGIVAAPGITLKTFLCDQLSIPPDYLEDRIQTILVNSRAIDDVDQIHLNDEDVIALSAAMPGLAGATLRRGSHLSAMRHEISQEHDTAAPVVKQGGVVTLKLFNMVAREMGPRIIASGILLKERDLRHLQNHYPDLPADALTTSPLGWIKLQILTTR